MVSAIEYWDNRYTLPEGIAHHARQNEQIANDFSKQVKSKPSFGYHLNEKLLCEIGCGTGDLTSILTDRHYCASVGTDLSALAVEIASIRFDYIEFRQHNILKDQPPLYGEESAKFEVALSSNVIEHFKNPRRVIDKMFKIAPVVVIVAPYNQPVTDGYDEEGGAGHVSTITFGTFDPYRVVSHFLFRTKGWDHSSRGEIPTQIAAVLGKK